MFLSSLVLADLSAGWQIWLGLGSLIVTVIGPLVSVIFFSLIVKVSFSPGKLSQIPLS